MSDMEKYWCSPWLSLSSFDTSPANLQSYSRASLPALSTAFKGPAQVRCTHAPQIMQYAPIQTNASEPNVEGDGDARPRVRRCMPHRYCVRQVAGKEDKVSALGREHSSAVWHAVCSIDWVRELERRLQQLWPHHCLIPPVCPVPGVETSSQSADGSG